MLRGLPGFSAFLTNKYKSLCHGNRYCATIHAINDALIKMSRVTTAEKLYRGVGGFRLPDTFMTPDEWNVRGGVEFGFLSATTDRAVAMQYASGRGSGIVYEIQQGMGDRGASLDWLSQYPHESEVCFPPLLGLELQTRADGRPAKRTEGAVVVVELRPCVGRGKKAIGPTEPPLASRLASLTWVPIDAVSEDGKREDGTKARGFSNWRICGRILSRNHPGALLYLPNPVLLSIGLSLLLLPTLTAIFTFLAESVGLSALPSLTLAAVDILYLIIMILAFMLMPRVSAPSRKRRARRGPTRAVKSDETHLPPHPRHAPPPQSASRCRRRRPSFG